VFEELSPTEFEEFCFELLVELRFVNVDWRKGTGKDASPPDQGRDIQAQWQRTEVDGSMHLETWFVECKHHAKGVPPEELQSLLTWAEAERPDVALVIASGFLSNPAKENLQKCEANRRPPFRIKYWERPILERLTGDRDDLLTKYLVVEPGPRAENEILEAEQEFHDRIWYVRKWGVIERHESGERPVRADLWDGMQKAMRRVEEEYGKDNLGPYSDFEWGMLNGKLSALRWVLGDEWDMLDT
jgi:hypothetical protein